jgi:hypothetical protein
MALIKAGTESGEASPVGEEPIPAAAAIVAPDATPGGEQPVPEEELPPALTGEGEEPAAELETEGEDDFGDRAAALLKDDDEKAAPKKPEAKEPEKKEESVKPVIAPFQPSAKTAATAADYLKQRIGQSGIPSTPAPVQPRSAMDIIMEARKEKAEARHAEAEKHASGTPGSGKGNVATNYGDLNERKLNRATAMLQHIRGVTNA